MSVIDVFSRRYYARLHCGLFDDDLHLHDYTRLQEQAERIRETPPEIENRHIDEELKLRQQVRVAWEAANENRKVRDLPRRARETLADVYLQNSDPLVDLARADIDWIWGVEGQAPQFGPVQGQKFGFAARVFIFDFIEAFFDLLPSDEQLEFSRDLNSRLQQGASRWYFQLGRWLRDDWPRERDGQFDHILFGLRRQANIAALRHVNAAEEFDGDDAQYDDRVQEAQFQAAQAAEALRDAAYNLWTADRLLNSDLMAAKVRHKEAIKLARAAFDSCVAYFGGPVMGPFVKPKAPQVIASFFGSRELDEEEVEQASAKMTGVLRPEAAALRLKQLGEHLLSHENSEERAILLRRVPMAEFFARLIIFGPSKKEVSQYSLATRAHLGVNGQGLSHGDGRVELDVEDANTARLAVDMLAQLCLFSTGGDGEDDEAQKVSGPDLFTVDHMHPRAADFERERKWQAIRHWTLASIGVITIFVAGALLGAGLAGQSLFGVISGWF